MSSEPDFLISFAVIKQALLSNTPSLQIFFAGIELTISLAPNTSSSHQSPAPSSCFNQRLVYQILLKGSLFDVTLPALPPEELSCMKSEVYFWTSRRLSTVSPQSTSIFLHGRKLEVNPAVEGTSNSQPTPHHHPLERQLLSKPWPDPTHSTSLCFLLVDMACFPTFVCSGLLKVVTKPDNWAISP